MLGLRKRLGCVRSGRLGTLAAGLKKHQVFKLRTVSFWVIKCTVLSLEEDIKWKRFDVYHQLSTSLWSVFVEFIDSG